MTRSRTSLSRWFWAGFLSILVAGVLALLFAGIRAGKQWADLALSQAKDLPPAVTEVIRVTLTGGDALYVAAEAVPKIQAETRAWLEHRRQALQEPLGEVVDRETERIFRAASDQVPVFADWYFSLSGEYARLFHAAVGDLPDHIAAQLQRLVFDPANTASALEAMAGLLDERITGGFRETVSGLEEVVSRFVREDAVSDETATIEVAGDWNLGGQFADLLTPYLTLTGEDLVRQGAATSAGAGLAAVTAKKLGAMTVAKASAKLAAGEGAGALAAGASKLGLKSAAKLGTLGGAGAGAASGATLCAATVVGAPLAPGCALIGGAITGVATWLLVDKAVLEAEELLGRDAFEEDLRAALEAQRDELRSELRDHYRRLTDQGLDRMAEELTQHLAPSRLSPEKTFIPARAGERAPPTVEEDDRP